MNTVTYEIMVRDDMEAGRLRGISHSYGGEPLGNSIDGQPCRTKAYAVDERLADLFEADCELDDAVLAYGRVDEEFGYEESQSEES